MQGLFVQLLVLALSTADNWSSENLRFLISSENDLIQYNISNLNTYDNIFKCDQRVDRFDYHLSKNLLFILCEDGLHKTPLIPGKKSVGQTRVHSLNGEGFAVDWVHDYIYWAYSNIDNGRRNTIMKSTDLNGDNESVLFSIWGFSGPIRSMHIDPIYGRVFWTGLQFIGSCNTMGKHFQIMNTEGYVLSLALDQAAKRVYYVEVKTEAILYSMDYEGGASLKIFSATELHDNRGLGLVRGMVYWVSFVAGYGNVLYKAPLQSTNERRVENLTKFHQDGTMVHGRGITHYISMLVVHPDLQKQPKHDPCQEKGCGYHCMIQNSMARCDCPEGQVLGEDGTTCLHKLYADGVIIISENDTQDENDKNDHTLRGETIPNDIQYTTSTFNSDNSIYLGGLTVNSNNDINIDAVSSRPVDNDHEFTKVFETEVSEGKETTKVSENGINCCYLMITIIVVITMAILTIQSVLLCKYWYPLHQRHLQEPYELSSTPH